MRRRVRGANKEVVKKTIALMGSLSSLILVLIVIGLVIRSGWGSVWDKDRFYVMAVVQDDWVRIVGVEMGESRGVELVIPGTALVPVVGTKGELRANTLWRFGENEKRASELVKSSLESWLGVNIDAVVRVTGTDLDWIDAWKADDGVLADRLRAVKVWKELREDQRKGMRIPDGLMEVKQSPDGESELVVDESGLKSWVEDLWTDSTVLDEKLSIEIINASSEPGMGRLMEQILRSGGGLVISVQPGEKEDGGCWFKGGDMDEYGETIDWLQRQIGCRWEGREGVSKGVVQLYVGDEWAKRYRRG